MQVGWWSFSRSSRVRQNSHLVKWVDFSISHFIGRNRAWFILDSCNTLFVSFCWTIFLRFGSKISLWYIPAPCSSGFIIGRVNIYLRKIDQKCSPGQDDYCHPCCKRGNFGPWPLPNQMHLTWWWTVTWKKSGMIDGFLGFFLFFEKEKEAGRDEERTE